METYHSKKFWGNQNIFVNFEILKGFLSTTWYAFAYTFFEEKKSFMKMDALFVENLILSDDNTWWSTISENNHLIPLPTLPDRLGYPLGALILVPQKVCLSIQLFWGKPWSFTEIGCHHHIRKLFLTMAALHSRNHPNHRSSSFRTVQVKFNFFQAIFFLLSFFFLPTSSRNL